MKPTIKDVNGLLIDLKQYIADDYHCQDDTEDDCPGMTVTIATTDGNDWSYQTGDNSYTGGCYNYQHWAVVSLYKDSNCLDLAREAIEELKDLMAY